MSLKEKIRLIVNNWIKANSGKGFTKLPFARFMYDKLTYLLKPKIIEINNYKLFLDKKDEAKISVFNEYEPFETEIVKKQVKEGMTAVNIGAHIGYYTILIARLVGDKGKVFAFEPVPENYRVLEKNIKLNNLKNTILVKKAVSDENGKVKLHLSSFSSLMNSLVLTDSVKSGKEIEVEAVRLDNFFKNKKVDFILMDIEGAEEKALSGMQNLLKKNKNIKIILELIPPALENAGTTFKKTTSIIRKLGFRIYGINEKYKKIKELKDIGNFLKNRKDKVCDNFLLIRGKYSEN